MRPHNACISYLEQLAQLRPTEIVVPWSMQFSKGTGGKLRSGRKVVFIYSESGSHEAQLTRFCRFNMHQRNAFHSENTYKGWKAGRTCLTQFTQITLGAFMCGDLRFSGEAERGRRAQNLRRGCDAVNRCTGQTGGAAVR